MPAQSLPGGRPLDPEPPADDPVRPEPDPTPGLRAQLAATRLAVMGFIRAHIDLARAELDEIKGEVARAAGLAAVAVAVLILAALLVSVAGILFLGEWIFGSIGWGVLLGAELLIAIAITAVLAALRVPGLGRDVVSALLPGFVVALILGLNLPNQLFAAIGSALTLGVDPAVRPLVVGVVLVALVGAVVGLVAAIRSGGGAGAILVGLFGGALAGMLFGAFLAVEFGWRVSIALGVATFLLAWPVLMGLRTKRQGIDIEVLKARFYPATTIDTTKESIEWAKARVQRGPRS
jgi:hypothetical protein